VAEERELLKKEGRKAAREQNMSDKLKNVLELSDRHKLEITRDAESWQNFLRISASHYKYSFED
jgi:hypothetical protein